MRKAIVLGALVLAAAAPAASAARFEPVPILELHVIGDPAPGAPDTGLYDSAASFRRQVAWLRSHGYHAVTLDELLREWRSAGWLALPRRPVVLTFDDGYPGDVRVALPVLRAAGWPAVLNLQIGNLAPARVRRLIDAGWEIDVHTFTHPDLTGVGAARLRREVSDARRWIRGVFDVPADFFCYPFGRFDAAVVSMVRRAGYLGAETELPGYATGADGLYRLHRIEVVRDDGVAGLARKLS